MVGLEQLAFVLELEQMVEVVGPELGQLESKLRLLAQPDPSEQSFDQIIAEDWRPQPYGVPEH